MADEIKLEESGLFVKAKPKPRRYKFVPQPDITAYELARLLPYIAARSAWGEELHKHIAALPEECKRHIEVMEEDG